MKFVLKLLLPLSLVNALMGEVETFYADAHVGTAQGNTILEDGKNYVIVISGTYSKWGDQSVCGGAPESTVMFPSENTDNGKAYVDPSFVFAYPERSSFCTDTPAQVPAPSPLSYWDGAEWVELFPIVNEYREDHTYEYFFEGTGEPLQVRKPDEQVIDNYGQLKIEIYEYPSIEISGYNPENLKVDFYGVLQTSEDGAEWADESPQPENPYIVPADDNIPFLRTREP